MDESTTIPAATALASRRFLESAPRVALAEGRVIGVEGQPCDALYLILDGQVLITQRQPAGDERPLYLIGEQDVFGEDVLTPARRWTVTAQAVSDGRACQLSLLLLSRLICEYPELAIHLFARLACRLHQAHHCMERLSVSPARDRVLALLRSLAVITGEAAAREVWVPLRVTQGELGAMVGMSRETVTRALGDLEADGIIRRAGRAGLWLLGV